MPISFDTTGFHRLDQNTWQHPSGDQAELTYYGLVPDLPAGLDDLPKLRHDLALVHGESGCLVEAHVVQLDGVPALLRIVKVPLPNQPNGQAFICSFTVPKANCSAVLQLGALERGMTGAREAVLAAEIGFGNWVRPHPYAPELEGRLPFHAGDDPRYDARFPDHPLSRVRAWAHHVVRTARLDPQFAALPPFQVQAPPPVAPGQTLVTALPSLPVKDFVGLQIGEETTYWRMTDPKLGEMLGRGLMGRSPLTDTRFRDMLLIDVATGEAMIPDRFTTDGNMTAHGTHLVQVSLSQADAELSDDDVVDAFKWAGRMCGEAAGRGEHLSLEPIQHQGEQADPHVLLAVRPHEGQRVVIAQFSPPPAGGPFAGSPSRSAPATAESVEGIGVIAGMAANEWRSHPLRLAITYRRSTG
ncbi:hypothetical protein SAMN05216188_118137 [Lentzea xinjiangensis]|uniref:Uncharacterized protein n=1 Tax=Lentzea xinjiangensis TaxID=402600 RepID=A0A1H9TIZ3_9PSEU|nr:hypothetical protein [Lentzea xinjiangensis]SER96809.1 hypothetical protein SAMN05216188_118137 [Lentzea xinjiangensis]